MVINVYRKKRRQVLLFLSCWAALYFVLVKLFVFPPQAKWYTAADFGIQTVKSTSDYNHNGIDDTTDILNGAKQDAANRPRYRNKSYPDGYPPAAEGVCTDIVWRAFLRAGYILKDMVAADIAQNPERYPHIVTPNPNGDFRQVRTLKLFFDAHARSLTTDLTQIAQWQAGDIVVFGENYSHIGILSDKRNQAGIPYLLHHSGKGQIRHEENILAVGQTWAQVVAHYRFPQ